MSEYELRKTLLEEAKLVSELTAFHQKLQEINFNGAGQDKSKKQQIDQLIFNIETITVKLLTLRENLESIKRTLNDSELIDSIEDIRQDYLQRYDMSEREINHYLSKNRTKGSHSEAWITLPTKESNCPFYLDELKILEAIEREREQNYSFITNNCVSSVKRCLIAGLTDNTRAALKARAGFIEDDFKMNKMETPMAFQIWLAKLRDGLQELNFPKQKTSKIESHTFKPAWN
ncbi:hypothetical protein ACNVED_14435 [Legionella sp. D16C41]|uniref:hypothetical protein n=1 Tax=Legionella sp. D16C41 TaxID=3402688 RepID=UPI003AF66E76